MKIREWIKEQEEHECPEGQRWCPIQKKCVTPSGKGMGPGKTNEEMSDKDFAFSVSRALVFAIKDIKRFHDAKEVPGTNGFKVKVGEGWVEYKPTRVSR